MVSSTSASRSQIESAEQLDELGIVQLDAFLVIGGCEKLKRATLQSLVPNAEPIAIPEQDLDSIAFAVHENRGLEPCG